MYLTFLCHYIDEQVDKAIFYIYFLRQKKDNMEEFLLLNFVFIVARSIKRSFFSGCKTALSYFIICFGHIGIPFKEKEESYYIVFAKYGFSDYFDITTYSLPLGLINFYFCHEFNSIFLVACKLFVFTAEFIQFLFNINERQGPFFLLLIMHFSILLNRLIKVK